ncbi:lipoate--protein ligase, partial [Escherichia coli]
DVERGMISRAQIFTDSLDPAPLEQLAQLLTGQRYSADAVTAVFTELMAGYPDMHDELIQLRDWLVAELQ